MEREGFEASTSTVRLPLSTTELTPPLYRTTVNHSLCETFGQMETPRSSKRVAQLGFATHRFNSTAVAARVYEADSCPTAIVDANQIIQPDQE